MDIYSVLRNEHHEILRACRHILQVTEEPQKVRAEVFAELEPLVSFHLEAEERIVYPWIRGRDAFRADGDRAVAEHTEVRHLLADLGGRRPRDERWLRIFKKLAEKLEQHLRFEEETLFAELAESIDKDNAFEMGIQYRELAGRHVTKHRHGPRLSP